MTSIARTVARTVSASQGRIRPALAKAAGAITKWWRGLEPGERVFYRAAGSLGLGMAFCWPPFLLIVPGILWTLVFFGFDLRRNG